jgi:uncharacterized iron-regulated membrane protein
MEVRALRQLHRWVGFPAAIFLIFAAITGTLVAFTEFFGEAERLREESRDMTSYVRVGADAGTWYGPVARAVAGVAQVAPSAPIDRITIQFKGKTPTVALFTGKPGGGEDRRFVFDTAGALLSTESYADKPFLYRLHSGEAFGDGGLVVAMFWGLALAILGVSGVFIYWSMRGKRELTGLKRIFW